jgi:hypothetical protein
MESMAGGAPTFYDGDAINILQQNSFPDLGYPSTRAVPGSVTGGTITWTVPTADVGGVGAGSTLYSATGFTFTQATSSGSQAYGHPPSNVIDGTPPFTVVLGTQAVTPEAPLVPLLALPGLAAAVAWRLMRRRRTERGNLP